jgi:hypothetical protein
MKMNRNHHKKPGQWWRLYSFGMTAVVLVSLGLHHVNSVVAFAKNSLDLLWSLKREVIEFLLVLGAACFRHGKR